MYKIQVLKKVNGEYVPHSGGELSDEEYRVFQEAIDLGGKAIMANKIASLSKPGMSTGGKILTGGAIAGAVIGLGLL